MIKGQVFTPGHVEPGLYLAATPIGNLGDITIRVLETLAGCDLIACEDTRVTGKLLRHYGIKNKTIAYHEHNADAAGPGLINDVKSGKSVVLVSDAGTPIVSDPGFRLVKLAHANALSVIPLPGSSAPLTALVASGMVSETWTFAGFLPSKQGARLTRLSEFSRHPATAIFFESPNRLLKTLHDMQSVFGPDRTVCVARELTKLHEEIVTLPISEMIDHYGARSIKGEIVMLVAPDATEEVMDASALLSELLQTMSTNKAASEAATITGKSKRELYQLALSLKAPQP